MAIKDRKPGAPGSWETEEDPLAEALAKALDKGELLLSVCTGHDEYQRRKIVYYALATHFLRGFGFFPVLVLYGPPSTGKSRTLDQVINMSRNPIAVTAEAITEAVLKQLMKDARLGTLVFEEGDKISARDLEGILITRCSPSAATAGKMVPDGKGWVISIEPTFGATVIHVRNLFKDPALLRRVIPVRTKRRKGDYGAIGRSKVVSQWFARTLRNLPPLPAVNNLWDIEPGVFDCYRPLLAVATALDDTKFIGKLVGEMESAASRLRDEETYLEAPTLLKVFPELVFRAVGGKFTVNRVSIETRDITPALRDEFGASCPALMLSANQRNRIFREDLGFQIGASHGRSRVYLTIPRLIELFDEHNLRDDLIEEWRKEMEGQKGQ